MKILTVCDQGNNRSVQFAHLLKYKYKGSDVIPIGLDTTTPETQKMLFDWADHIILTEDMQQYKMPAGYESKIRLWHVGSDNYPRPFNPELNALARQKIEENPLS